MPVLPSSFHSTLLTVPARYPVMKQTWRDLLFAHWPVAPQALVPHMPPMLVPDQHSGSAWIGIIPFRMTGIRPYGLPAIPVLSETLELNVRTYTTVAGVPGVYFFSLDAASRLAVRIARRFFHLPYFDATMTCREDESFHYTSARRESEACCNVTYAPTGGPSVSVHGSLAHFLTERYALYTTDSTGSLYRGDIHHRPWELQPAHAQFDLNTMTRPLDLTLSGPPLLHFSRELEVSILGLSKC